MLHDTPVTGPQWYPPDADHDDYDALLAAAYHDYFTDGQAIAVVADTRQWHDRLDRLANLPSLDLRWQRDQLAIRERDGQQWTMLLRGTQSFGPPADTIGYTSQLEVRWWLACAGAVQPADLTINGFGGRLDQMTLWHLDGDLAAADRLRQALAGARLGQDQAVFHLDDDELGRTILAALDAAGYAHNTLTNAHPRRVDSGGLTSQAWRVPLHANTFSDAPMRWTLAVDRAQARHDGHTPRREDDPALLALPMGPGAQRRYQPDQRASQPATTRKAGDRAEQATLF